MQLRYNSDLGPDLAALGTTRFAGGHRALGIA